MKRNLLIIYFIALSSITLTAQTKKEKKAAAKEKGYAYTKTMIESGKYYFEAKIATTSKGERIDISSDSNNLIINKDNANINLPYFGVTQSPISGASSNTGIIFDGKIKDYTVTYNDKKRKTNIRFIANGHTGNFKISIVVKTTGISYLTVNSTGRNTISYTGITNPINVAK